LPRVVWRAVCVRRAVCVWSGELCGCALCPDATMAGVQQWEESEPLVQDKYGDATQGHGNFGGGYPSDGTTDPQLIREMQREEGGVEWDGQDPNELTYEPYDMDPRMKARYDLYEKESRHDDIGIAGGWSKEWNAGSWVGFVILGPVLTAGVCSFVFMTRGMLWGFVVLGGLIAFDLLMYYFG